MNFSQTRIAVLGGRKISDNIYQKAYKLGFLLAKEGYLVYCGGGKGVMEAISKGVSEKGGTCVGILKGSMLDEMNDFIKVPIATNMGISRNALLAYNCDVAVAISGKYGTLSEISYVLQLDKPIIGLHSCDNILKRVVKEIDNLIKFIKENT